MTQLRTRVIEDFRPGAWNASLRVERGAQSAREGLTIGTGKAPS